MMGDAKRGDLAVTKSNIDMACRRFMNWLVKQRLPPFREAFIDAYLCIGSSMFMGKLAESIIHATCLHKRIHPPTLQSQFLFRCGGYKPLVESFIARDFYEIGNNILLMRVCNASISYVVKNIRGKEDVHTSIVAGFGYGVAISLATGMRGPSVLSIGAMCAVFNGGMFKAGIKMFAYDHTLDRVSWRR